MYSIFMYMHKLKIYVLFSFYLGPFPMMGAGQNNLLLGNACIFYTVVLTKNSCIVLLDHIFGCLAWQK